MVSWRDEVWKIKTRLSASKPALSWAHEDLIDSACETRCITPRPSLTSTWQAIWARAGTSPSSLLQSTHSCSSPTHLTTRLRWTHSPQLILKLKAGRHGTESWPKTDSVALRGLSKVILSKWAPYVLLKELLKVARHQICPSVLIAPRMNWHLDKSTLTKTCLSTCELHRKRIVTMTNFWSLLSKRDRLRSRKVRAQLVSLTSQKELKSGYEWWKQSWSQLDLLSWCPIQARVSMKQGGKNCSKMNVKRPNSSLNLAKQRVTYLICRTVPSDLTRKNLSAWRQKIRSARWWPRLSELVSNSAWLILSSRPSPNCKC